MRPLYGEPEVDNHRFAIYHLHYKEKPGMTESVHDSFLLQPSPKLLSPPGVSFNCCGWRNLSAAFFLAHNSNVCIAKPGMVNGFDLGFVIKQTLNMQSYEEQEIDEIRWICGKDNPADVMTKILPNSALEGIISTNKATIRLERWVKR